MKNTIVCCLGLFHFVSGSLRLTNTEVKKAKPVDVFVLTEALCPGCEAFLVESLWPAYQDLGTDVMNITVIPFGNAHVDEESETVECQHGGGECDANTYELCAIEMVKHVADYLPFLVCNAETLPAGFHTGPYDPEMFHACADKSGLWWEALLACHDSASMAWHVTLKAAKNTPDHPYVPYVLLNGGLLEDGVDFQTEVCRLYKQQGGCHPKCCGDSATDPVQDPFKTSEKCPNDDGFPAVFEA